MINSFLTPIDFLGFIRSKGYFFNFPFQKMRFLLILGLTCAIFMGACVANKEEEEAEAGEEKKIPYYRSSCCCETPCCPTLRGYCYPNGAYISNQNCCTRLQWCKAFKCVNNYWICDERCKKEALEDQSLQTS